MKPIGTQSVTLLFLLAALSGIVAGQGGFHLSALEQITAEVAVCLGVFTILVGTWVYRFWDLANPSRSYFRISIRGSRFEGEQVLLEVRGVALLSGPTVYDRPKELPHLLLRLACQGICLLIGLLCFNTRSVALMLDTPRRVIYAGAQYCPAEEPAEEKAKKPQKPGCELILRAYQLGYVKSLGSCAPEEEEEKLELCTLRQLDEPYLHYSARLFMRTWDQALGKTGGSHYLVRMRSVLEAQLKHFDPLLAKQKYVIENSAKASHHIFTNLPYPEGRLAHEWKKWFEPNDCLARYRKLPHTISVSATDPSADGKLLDHVYGQLLFHSRYEEAAGNCKEYEIHWGSPEDSCETLAREPEKFLTQQGLLPPLRGLLDRLKEKQELDRLDGEVLTLKSSGLVGPIRTVPATPRHNAAGKLVPKVPASPETLISFQCFMGSDKPGIVGPQSFSFQVLGQKFAADVYRFQKDPNLRKVHVSLYKHLSTNLAEGFHYTSYLSRAGNAVASGEEVGPELFVSPDYPLAQLEFLKNADIFLGNDWLQSREDLLEIYPYYHHLYHFVQLFRQTYRMKRTHL